MSDNITKCLSLAEDLIQTLPDKDIVNRYFAIKAKIMQTESLSSIQNKQNQSIFQSFQDATMQTQSLQSQLYTEISKRPTFLDDADNESIALQLHELQKKILPGQPLPASSDALDELESVRRVIDAKLNSLTLVRNKIREENLRLTNDYKALSIELGQKVSEVKQKETEEYQKIAKEEAELNDKYSLVEAELEDLREFHDSLISEHNDLSNDLTDAMKAQRQTEMQIKTISDVIKSKEAERQQLNKSIEDMKKELSQVSRAVAEKKFGTGNEDLLDEVIRLNEQADLLRSQTAQMELQLKRYPSIASDIVMATELDEDEIAKQILLSGMK